MTKDAVDQEARFKYGPEHEHAPRTRCPVSACTWPLSWQPSAAVGRPVVLPLTPDVHEVVEGWAAEVRAAGFELAMSQPVQRPTPAPQPADLFKRDLEVPAAAHPAPLVPARGAREVEIPSAARGVRKLAEGNSWIVRCTYALGWVLGARGETRALTHSLALRMSREATEHRLVAVWSVKEPHEGLLKLQDRGVCDIPVPTTGWKFDLAYGWGAGQPHHKLSAAALKESIKEA